MKKTQTGWAIIILLIGLNLIISVGFKNLNDGLILAIISVIILILFGSLTIEVDNEYVKFYFGIGIFRKKFRLKDIYNCRPVNYFSLGWGIRFQPGIVLYNVSGNKAIELSIKGKYRKVRIGTNEPEVIAKFINSKL